MFHYSDSIGKVQQNTEFYWRYQRYSFVREYFQHPILAYPPLTIIPHVILLSYAIKRKFCSNLDENQQDGSENVSLSQRWTPIFSECQVAFFVDILLKHNLEMISKKDGLLDEHWDLFENAATHSHARLVSEQTKKRNTSSNDEISGRKTTTTSKYILFMINLPISSFHSIVLICTNHRV